MVKKMTYSGVKIAMRRLVCTDLHGLLDKSLEKINIWGNKFLSLQGRITLIKSVISAFPIFQLTHALVPKSILADIDKLCWTFIWHIQDGKEGIHYVNWEVLCKPIEFGGRGIHSCSKYVGPKRAKLTWNYLNDKDCLLRKILSLKYGLTTSNSVKKKSTAWKIITDGAKALDKITRW
ncbi:uncharacterized protein LOC110106540 [Dendrobium catenatum]|uniref:uncharacterized protein LOC110106540 n=1 Tax=Dendrobium catenatum TaxID=906689 RepID=UPI0009F1675D|nr:uncharacterized protein LOC110106540 [Dendrobium catenatum]